MREEAGVRGLALVSNFTNTYREASNMTANHQAANDVAINEHTGKLAGQLLDVQDKLYDVRSELEFYTKPL